MRRIAAIFMAVLLVFSLATGVYASRATGVQTSAVVTTDGNCQVAMSVNLSLDSVVQKLTFPLPAGARGVSVNGSAVGTYKSGDVMQADISRLVKGLTGNFTLLFHYSLSGCASVDELGRTIVTVPLLSGFSYPIDSLTFNVTLPGEPLAKPTFTSGYYQSSIETILEYDVSGQTISGFSTGMLKDLETMSISVEMPPELFPQQQVQEWSVVFDDIAMYVCAGVAFLYWLIFLRALPPKRQAYSIAPESFTAGEIGSALTGQGGDLTMMVLTWAQLGYLRLELDRHGRVSIHKRMDMGNERSGYENRIYQSLFGKRQTVEGNSYHYATLSQKVALSKPNVPDFFRPGTGNPTIFRIIAAGIGVFGGMSLGLAMGRGAFLAGFVVFLMVTFGTVSSWFIQSGAQCLFLHDKQRLWISLGLCGAWLLFGLMAGEFGVAAAVAAAQFVAGLAAAYGGRRTEVGRRTMSQLLGLRRFLRKAPKGEFQKITQDAPDYFFSMAPYAIALGAADQFAAQFGTMHLPACPYLVAAKGERKTAQDWMKTMKEVIYKLNIRRKKLLLERLMPR